LQAKQSDKLVTSFFSAQRSPDSENDMVELPEKKNKTSQRTWINPIILEYGRLNNMNIQYMIISIDKKT
jgi:hypothetical protein